MTKILTIERIKEILDYNSETGLFYSKRNGEKVGSKANQHGFWCMTVNIDGKNYRAHRIAWAYINEYFPKNEIDHINLDPLDNRICNLREADRSQNECNKIVRADNRVGIKGIHYDKSRKKWQMQIKFKAIKIMKRFAKIEDAILAYAQYSKELHGEFGRIN